MTAQELFDIVYKHLTSQNAKSMMVVTWDGGLSCAYRGKGGLMCAIGVLIPDEDYRADMERLAAQNLLAKGACLHHLAAHHQLIDKLQYIHDYSLVEDWDRALREAAVSFGLVCS